MRILIVSSLYEPYAHGGAERVAQSVAESLAGQGHEVHVACLDKEGQAHAASMRGVQVHYLPLRNLYWPFPVSNAPWAMKVAWHLLDSHNAGMARAFGALVDRIRPALVNTHNIAGFSAAVWRAAARRGLPVAHTLHDHYLLCPYSTMFRDGRNCERPCLRCRAVTPPRRAMSRHVRAVIGVSRYILERHLAEGLFAHARASVVFNGYDAASGPEHAAGSGPLQFGFMGSLVPNKGLDELLDAFLALPAGAAELRIAGAGDPAYAAALRQRTAGRADVRWLGVVRPEAHLPGLDLLVVPSRNHEPLPRVIVEALSFGVPVLASRRGGMPELLEGGGGWLYEPGGAGELRDRLATLLQDRAPLAAARAAARAQAPRYSIAAMTAGYLQAYEAAIAGAGSGH